MKSAVEKFTDNELATAWFACGHASAFWRNRIATGGSYAKKESARYDALSKKLNTILDAREKRRG